jgi:Rad52/22 family double-strand break repair protein
MNRALLEHPFDPAQIKQRRGRNGVLDYVEGHTVVARLNAALDGAWSFEVVAHEVRDHEVLVLGKLTAAGIVKMQFGASQVTRDRETKALISLGDDLKAAATDALKKCATFLGVGLHLYAERPLRPEAARPAWAGLLPGSTRSVPDGNGAGATAPVAAPPPPPPASRRGSGTTSPPAVPAAHQAATPSQSRGGRHAAPAPDHLADRPRQGARPRGGGGDEPPGVQPAAGRPHDRGGVSPDPPALNDAARGGLTAARNRDPTTGEGEQPSPAALSSHNATSPPDRAGGGFPWCRPSSARSPT